MSCRHDLAGTTCKRCYPDAGTTDPGPEEDYEPNMEGPGAITREEYLAELADHHRAESGVSVPGPDVEVLKKQAAQNKASRARFAEWLSQMRRQMEEAGSVRPSGGEGRPDVQVVEEVGIGDPLFRAVDFGCPVVSDFDTLVGDLLAHEDDVLERLLGAGCPGSQAFALAQRPLAERSVVRAFAAIAGAMMTFPITNLRVQAHARLAESMEHLLQAARVAREAESTVATRASQPEVSDVTVQWSDVAPVGWEVRFRMGSEKTKYHVRFGSSSMAEYRARAVARALSENETGQLSKDGTPATKDVRIWWHTASAPLGWAVVFNMGIDELSYEVRFGPEAEDRWRADVIARRLERARYYNETPVGGG